MLHYRITWSLKVVILICIVQEWSACHSTVLAHEYLLLGLSPNTCCVLLCEGSQWLCSYQRRCIEPIQVLNHTKDVLNCCNISGWWYLNYGTDFGWISS